MLRAAHLQFEMTKELECLYLSMKELDVNFELGLQISDVSHNAMCCTVNDGVGTNLAIVIAT